MIDNIHDLLDGELAAEKEVELLSAMATDSSLREEFKDQISIRTAVNADRRAFVPSPDATASLMGKLGFAGGVAALTTAATKPAYFGYVKAIVISLISALTGYILGQEYFGTSADSELAISEVSSTVDTVFIEGMAETQATKSSVKPQEYSQSDYSKVAELQTELAYLKRKLEKANSLTFNNSISASDLSKYESSDKEMAISESRLQSMAEELSQIKKLYSAIQNENLSYQNELVASNSRAEEYYSIKTEAENMNDDLQDKISILEDKLSTTIGSLKDGTANLGPEYGESSYKGNKGIYFIGSIYRYEADARIAPNQYPSLNNMSVGMRYSLWQQGDFSIDGLAEFRRENFSTSYPIRPGDPESPIAMQQPNYNTFSLGGRLLYDISDLVKMESDRLAIYGDMNVGMAFSADVMAVGGTVLRPRVGAQWRMNTSSYLTTGYDYSLLIFPHENDIFSNYKNGFFIGLGVDF
jgi:hypothetical protein